MIHITLGPEKRIDPNEDDLGRDRVGFGETMSPLALYDAGHGSWVIGQDRAKREKYALLVYDSIVRQAIEISSIDKLVEREPGDTRDDRSVINGTILTAGHPVHDLYVNKQSPLGPGRNPVRYFNSPIEGQLPCRCGCGGIVEGKDFLPGHDQTALHARVKQIGTVAEFLDWFDAVRRTRD